jgi:hypothetical protein
MSIHRKSAGSLGALAMLALLADEARATDWPTLGLDGVRTRLSAERSGPRFAAGWVHTLPVEREAFERKVLASPASADGVVVIATAFDQVRALRETDGKLLWSAVVRGSSTATPAVVNGRVFAASEDGTLHALRLLDGVELWRRNLGGMVYASPAVADGALFMATGSQTPRVLRVDPLDGHVVWQTEAGQLGQAAHASLAIGKDLLVVVEMNGVHHGFALADGAHRWTGQVAGVSNLAAPLIAGDTVFLALGGSEAKVHAVALDSGQALPGWPLVLPEMAEGGPGRRTWREHVLSSLAGQGGSVVFGRRLDERFDTDGDGLADQYRSREQVIFMAAQQPRVLSIIDNGQLETSNLDQVPLFALCATPAGFRGGAGEPLWAVASSLQPTLRVLSGLPGEEGKQLGQTALSAPTRSSPTFSNARLVIATDAGQVHSFPAEANQAPLAPLLGLAPGNGRAVDVRSVILQWGAAVDPDAGDGLPRYLVRIDDDGEVLQSWDAELALPAGQQSAPFGGLLQPDRTYTFAVRAQDAAGAFSAWSSPTTFRTVLPPVVSIGETVVATLEEAASRAQAGDVIRLGRGTYPLAATLQLPAGVTLAGAGPHLTTLDGGGLRVAVAPATGAELRQVRVVGAEIGVSVEAATSVKLRNVILSDNSAVGLAVEATGSAELVSATVARNGIGVRVRGATGIRNALATANGTGIAASDAALAITGYSDVWGNTRDWEGTRPHDTDLGVAVTFASGEAVPLLPTAAQPSTDRGDPADDYALEPVPNGGRINMGAYGNTPFAELSTYIPGPLDGGGGPGDAGSSGDDGGTAAPAKSANGGGCGCDLGGSRQPGGGFAGALLLVGYALMRGRRAR